VGNLYVASGGNIYKYTTDGIQSIVATDVDAPFNNDPTTSQSITGLACDGSGNLYASVNLFEGSRADDHIYIGTVILKFQQDGMPLGDVNGVVGISQGLTSDNAGDLFLLDDGLPEGSGIYEFILGGGVHQIFPAGSEMACDSAGDLFVSYGGNIVSGGANLVGTRRFESPDDVKREPLILLES
jgi:hypothetical protein